MISDNRSLCFSLRGCLRQLMMRMLSIACRIDQTRMRSGQLGSEDWDKVNGLL